jgi:hypothetical protein
MRKHGSAYANYVNHINYLQTVSQRLREINSRIYILLLIVIFPQDSKCNGISIRSIIYKPSFFNYANLCKLISCEFSWSKHAASLVFSDCGCRT